MSLKLSSAGGTDCIVKPATKYADVRHYCRWSPGERWMPDQVRHDGANVFVSRVNRKE